MARSWLSSLATNSSLHTCHNFAGAHAYSTAVGASVNSQAHITLASADRKVRRKVRLAAFYEENLQNLLAMTKIVLGDLDKLVRKIMAALITIDVEQPLAEDVLLPGVLLAGT